MSLFTGVPGIPGSKGGWFSKGDDSHVGQGLIDFKFAAWGAEFKPDMVHIHRVISEKTLGMIQGPSVTEEAPKPELTWYSNRFNEWLGGKAGEVPVAEVQSLLDSEEFLLPGEKVTYCLRLWRNTMVFTDKRLVQMMKWGFFGRIWGYKSIPWSSILAFQTITAGRFFLGAEVRIWLNSPADSQAFFRLSTNWIMKSVTTGKHLAKNLLLANRSPLNPSLLEKKWLPQTVHWLLGNYGEATEAMIESKLRNEVPLMEEETIFKGFKLGRKILALTNLRIIQMDVPWLTRVIKYRSIPYSSCKMWRISPGRVWHTIEIWTILESQLYGRLGKLVTGLLPRSLKSSIDTWQSQNFVSGLSRIEAKFQAANVDVTEIAAFLQENILQ